MPLRTYPLIIHPAFLRFMEHGRSDKFLDEVEPSQVSDSPPAIRGRASLASFLGVDALVIGSFLRNKEKHYRHFTVQKRSGGLRDIYAPRTFLKVTQWWILDTILNAVTDSPFSYGFSKGRGFIENARAHSGAKHVLNVDIKDFFPSINFMRVLDVFRVCGYRLDVSEMLADICTFQDTLPQGAPTSPRISSLFMKGADEKLASVAEKFGIATFTRYADDLTFSSMDRIDIQIISEIERELIKVGLKLNQEKTKFMGPNQVKEITGLVLCEDGIGLSRRFLNRTRGWFHSISQVPEVYPGQADRVRGTVELMRQVGGRGTAKVVQEGLAALRALDAVKPPQLEWGDE